MPDRRSLVVGMYGVIDMSRTRVGMSWGRVYIHGVGYARESVSSEVGISFGVYSGVGMSIWGMF